MTPARAGAAAPLPRRYWVLWGLTTALTGVVAGFMLGHALLLGRYLDWLLTSGRARIMAETYPAFRASHGKLGLEAFYAVVGLHIVTALGFAAVSMVRRRGAVSAAIAAVAAVLWPIVHYASGFAAVEARVYSSAAEVPADVARAFAAWNVPIHLLHAGILGVALVALLAHPHVARGGQPAQRAGFGRS